MVGHERTRAVPKVRRAEPGKLHKVAFHELTLPVVGAPALPGKQQNKKLGDRQQGVDNAESVTSQSPQGQTSKVASGGHRRIIALNRGSIQLARSIGPVTATVHQSLTFGGSPRD